MTEREVAALIYDYAKNLTGHAGISFIEVPAMLYTEHVRRVGPRGWLPMVDGDAVRRILAEEKAASGE